MADDLRVSTSIQRLDLSHLEAATVMLRRGDYRLYLVGCGGIGSWLAPHLVRLAMVLRGLNLACHVTLIDMDIVEPANVFRQNFCMAEADRGLNKAVSLAARYGTAWGIPVTAIPEPLDARHIASDYRATSILIGCVDNAAARQTMAKLLKPADHYEYQAPRLWWVDCANKEQSGQVSLGCVPDVPSLAYAFPQPRLCRCLPSPALQYPKLLMPRLEELADTDLSCEEMARRNAQSLTINMRVAAEAADYLFRLFLGGLDRFQTEFNLRSGTAQSKYITRTAVAAALDQPESIFDGPPGEPVPDAESDELENGAEDLMAEGEQDE